MTTNQTAFRLAELLSAKLCHDLAGPIGAVAAGSELLADEAGMPVDAEALGLLSGSAEAAVARVKFLRAAFGPAPSRMAGSELETLARRFLNAAGGGGSIGLVWDCLLDGEELVGGGQVEGELARLVCNLVLIGRDCLPFGGQVTLAGTAQSLLVMAEGRRAAMKDDSAAGLADGALPDSPRGAQAWFAKSQAEALKMCIAVDNAEGKVTLILKSLEIGRQGFFR